MTILKRSYSYLVILAVAAAFGGEHVSVAHDGGGWKKAFDACAAENGGAPVKGQPPSPEFRACMKKAGFGRPPMDSARMKAFESCSEKTGSKPGPGTPPSDAFKACMKDAGFSGPPPHHGPGGKPPASDGAAAGAND